ncbi:MAG: DNA topoisomerase VI subunit B [Gemmatimonadota bacterium]|nr:MAG: DNA topoisomerase VI subunit B [Gemmatimonadota bacterium]
MPKAPTPRATARTMAQQQREISVSEFFTKNRHLLGFDSPTKALLTTVKEAVDNALDACEEAGILPDLFVEVRPTAENRFRITVEDNGPGIMKAQIPRIFGKLLYGSKFHRLRQSRGQQGIGISAAGMYGQLTTGKPVVIESRTGPRKTAHRFELVIDTLKNEPVIRKDTEADWGDRPSGTRVEIELEGVHKGGRHGTEAYLRQTVLANPHVQIVFRNTKGEEVRWERAAFDLPPAAQEILPHPYGVELGVLLRMAKDTTSRQLGAFFRQEFSRVGPKAARAIVEGAGLSITSSPKRLSAEGAEKLIASIRNTRIPQPPTGCLSPIGAERMEASLREQVNADFYTAVSRGPSVYRGNPFQVEVGLAYGGELPADQLCALNRFANRVPLQYQQGACAISRAVLATNWRSYGLQQSRGALPTAPLVLLVHVASVWVPFTSESKEAVAGYDEILKELRLGLQDAGRKLGQFIRRGQRERDAARKRAYIEKYIPHIGIALQEILGLSEREEKRVVDTLTGTLQRSRKV